MNISKKITILLFLLLLVFSCGDNNSENENTANTTSTKQKNSSGNTDTETKNKAENTVQGIRYGSDTVGYVTKPKNWLEFTDSNSSPTAIQLSIDPVNIVTLDLLSKDGKANSEKAAYVLMQKYLNEGIPKENITLDSVDINGYQGTSLTIKYNDGTIMIVNCIDHEGKVYFISMEGLQNRQTLMEMAKVIETWKPTK
ncbi:hypothetical protein [Leptotrichia hongkongensis]|uniref:hypothetical protein n=1 Tax=Leptotrichia hongkongensis TaxID=554406 RepID=UPI0035A910D6